MTVRSHAARRFECKCWKSHAEIAASGNRCMGSRAAESPTAAKTSPFSVALRPLARNSAPLQTAKTLRPAAEDPPRRLNRSAELRRFKLPNEPATPPGKNPARRSSGHDFCGTPPAGQSASLFGGLRGKERPPLGSGAFPVRSLPRGLERVRELLPLRVLRRNARPTGCRVPAPFAARTANGQPSCAAP